MRKINFIFVIFLFIFSSCSEKSEPEFYYVKNFSDYPIEFLYNNTSVTIDSNKKDIINTLELSYSLNKTVKTFIDENSVEHSNEIKLLTDELYEGFYDGSFCKILKFSNYYSTNKQFDYNITNKTDDALFIVCKSFSERIIKIEKERAATFSFFYENPKIYFLTTAEYQEYNTETDLPSKENILKGKSIELTPVIKEDSYLKYQFEYKSNS